MTRRTHIALAWLGFVALLALHLDFWREREARIVLGWMPHELAYRLAWMALAWLYLAYVCKFVWRAEDEA
jgi:hypothetical protein